MGRRELVNLLTLLCLMPLAVACSTSKNTAGSRLYQQMVTRYNTYFNGHEAFKRAYSAQETQLSDNWVSMPPLFPSSNEKARPAGARDYDLSIEKAQKCIKLHSITAKPKIKSGKTLTAAEKRFRDKREYNPFLWHAWMLLADSQMHKGEFLEASGTYSYINGLFFDEPRVVAEANIKRAHCFSELEWYYEADELFARILADTIPPALGSVYDTHMAAHLIKKGEYAASIPHMERAVKRGGRSKEGRIRDYFLLGDLYRDQGNYPLAYKSYQKVINQNPPYWAEVRARIRQAQTMAGTKGHDKLFKKLEKMERDPNNEDYLDQIYFAKGNISLLERDTVKALEYWETGAGKANGHNIETGALLLSMANLYWEIQDYSNSGRCYSKAVGLIEQNHPQYETVKLRSQDLENLALHNHNIVLQDSLQHLATLDTLTLNAIIDKIIERVMEEEELALIEAEAESQRESGNSSGGRDHNAWYFYNSKLVESGKKSFTDHWGTRKFEDDWRRSNKTVLSDTPSPDTTPSDTTGTVSPEEIPSTEADTHKRAYYIQQIPFSPEMKRQSDRILTDALFNAGIIYKDQLSEYAQAEKSFSRIVEEYPEADERIKSLYNLFLIYSLEGKSMEADACKNLMQEDYPGHDLTITICDPDYIFKSRYARHLEDSLYSATYTAYKRGEMDTVRMNCAISASEYPTGAHRAKFLFLQAIDYLKQDSTQLFLSTLRTVVERYPQNEISELAGLIVQGVQDGRALHSSSFNSLWERRNTITTGDGTAPDTLPSFNDERNAPFMFVLAYPADSVNENKLLYEVAKYNFTNFMVRNFDIDFSSHAGMGLMTVSEFLNFDEAHFYMRKLWSDTEMNRLLQGLKAIIITEYNLDVLLHFYSFSEYEDFYMNRLLAIPGEESDGYSLFEEIETP